MGNQHDSQRSSMRRRTPSPPPPPNVERSDQHQIIDLDEIVEQWIWYMWNRTKTKSLSHYKREELLVTINWKGVTFTQSNAHFYGSPPVRLPRSQILFRTSFNNKTTTEQSYSFKTERFTRSTFKFVFTHSLTKSQESAVMFRLPEEIIQLGGGIKREQRVEFGEDTIKEYNMRWSVNSQICVAPRTCTYAELNVDEEEFDGDFSVFIQFFGRITATIATRQSPRSYLKFIDGDLVQIIREAMENNHRLNGIDIIEDNPPVVRFKMRGICSFRYGIQQHVVLNQQSLDSSSSPLLTQNNSPSNPTDYRPLRSHILSPNNDIQLKIIDD